MKVIIMGCGRVGSELSSQLVGEHDVTMIDKDPEAFYRYQPGEGTKTVVGLGFDRDVLEEAGIKDADAFVAVSSGDNSNIVSARVAREMYHVPKVIARIYDPRRAEIYERLNIPTVATTTWGIKQIQLMLFHDRAEIRESLGGGDLLRMRVAGTGASGRHQAVRAQRGGQDPDRRRLPGRRRIPPDRRELAAGRRLPGRHAHEGRHRHPGRHDRRARRRAA